MAAEDSSDRSASHSSRPRATSAQPSQNAGAHDTNNQEDTDAAPTDTPAEQSDEFRMNCFKVLACSKRGPHDWKSCPYVHPGEHGRRRPLTFQYEAVMCPFARKGVPCPDGDACKKSHHVFEMWLHPDRYRTQICIQGTACTRKLCFFAHTPEELRRPPPRRTNCAPARATGAAAAPQQQQLQQQGQQQPRWQWQNQLQQQSPQQQLLQHQRREQLLLQQNSQQFQLQHSPQQQYVQQQYNQQQYSPQLQYGQQQYSQPQRYQVQYNQPQNTADALAMALQRASLSGSNLPIGQGDVAVPRGPTGHVVMSPLPGVTSGELVPLLTLPALTLPTQGLPPVSPVPAVSPHLGYTGAPASGDLSQSIMLLNPMDNMSPGTAPTPGYTTQSLGYTTVGAQSPEPGITRNVLWNIPLAAASASNAASGSSGQALPFVAHGNSGSLRSVSNVSTATAEYPMSGSSSAGGGGGNGAYALDARSRYYGDSM